ncbi:hypothetical protein [Nocardia wallacei]|uniref:hypothetical protein n=1 Tax=Nocardia wallacei TaxID=480035 RepID=UPI00245709C3|nr:hypothetical protein [Nocardia wallacei]
MKTIIKMVAGVLLGIGLLIGGVVALTQHEVTCGTSVMSSGDQCEVTSRGGHVATRDYGEQQSGAKTGGWVMIGIGSVVVLVFGLGLLGALTPDKTSSPAPGSAPALPRRLG